ncbi:MAG: sigma-70 family RNA polymerase sigma factor [Clostridia bacterium]|nr:sigma-70 family RNA polymerase sigma factor [Clostridia bacterium]
MDNGASSYRRFLDGDENAFDEIVDSLFYNLVFFVNGYVHDIYAAEDIAMDAFSDLLANKKRYNFKVSLKTYVFMIGKSKALNYIKHNKILSIVDFSEVSAVTDDSEQLEEIVLANERKRIVWSALEKLPDNLQLAAHLVFFENMSYEEAAKVMNRSKKQVYNLMFRAKKELRTIIGEEGKSFL